MYKIFGPFLIFCLLTILHICPSNPITRKQSKIFSGLKSSFLDIIPSKMPTPSNFRLLTASYKWHSPIMCITSVALRWILSIAEGPAQRADGVNTSALELHLWPMSGQESQVWIITVELSGESGERLWVGVGPASGLCGLWSFRWICSRPFFFQESCVF